MEGTASLSKKSGSGDGLWGSLGLLAFYSASGALTVPPEPASLTPSLLFQTLQLVPLHRCPEEAEALLKNLSGPVPAP